MKKIVTGLIVCALVGGSIAGVYYWHTSEMDTLAKEITEADLQMQHLNAVIASIQGQNDLLNSQNDSLQGTIAELTSQINDLLTEEVIIFNATMVNEELREISELVTYEYLYTNVAAEENYRYFKLTGWKEPFSKKTIIATMDGVMKAGIDFSKVEIHSSEDSKTITVSMPESYIISNELDEDSFTACELKAQLMNPITLDDATNLRKQIKETAVDNAKKEYDSGKGLRRR